MRGLLLRFTISPFGRCHLGGGGRGPPLEGGDGTCHVLITAEPQVMQVVALLLVCARSYRCRSSRQPQLAPVLVEEIFSTVSARCD